MTVSMLPRLRDVSMLPRLREGVQVVDPSWRPGEPGASEDPYGLSCAVDERFDRSGYHCQQYS